MAELDLGNEITEGVKKIMLAGIGAVAVTAEKSKELVDTLVAQGELTVNQGKVLNAELRRTVEERVAPKPEPAAEAPSLLDQIKAMSAEEIAELRTQLDKLDAPIASEEGAAE